MFDLTPFSKISLSGSAQLNDFLAMLLAKFDKFHSIVIQEFGPNGIYIMATFAVFLVLIALIYIKSVIDTFRIADGESSAAGLFYTAENANSGGTANTLADEAEEFLEDARPRLTINTNNEIPQNSQPHTYSEKRNAALEEKEQEISRDLVLSSATTDDILRLKDHLKYQAKQNQDIRLDWDKNVDNIQEELDNTTSLNYQIPQESMKELIGLIINMLSREVTPQKIAQAVYYRNQGEKNTEEILQTISAVRDFVTLCNTGKFNSIPARSELPSNNEALYNWAQGDNSLCLLLLENLIKQQIDTAETKSGLPQDLIYAQAASYSCLFGTIAMENNLELAQNSFELALELAPQSINAWSRCGDVYWQQKDYKNAVYAYQNVADNGDKILYAPQIANARHKLAEYNTDSGNTDTAAKLEKDSQSYYNEIGITKALSDKENESLNFIAENQQINLESSIIKLLQVRQAQYT